MESCIGSERGARMGDKRPHASVAPATRDPAEVPEHAPARPVVSREECDHEDCGRLCSYFPVEDPTE
jgi:hypothetical protein